MLQLESGASASNKLAELCLRRSVQSTLPRPGPVRTDPVHVTRADYHLDTVQEKSWSTRGRYMRPLPLRICENTTSRLKTKPEVENLAGQSCMALKL